jgi:hypothetical protein
MMHATPGYKIGMQNEAYLILHATLVLVSDISYTWIPVVLSCDQVTVWTVMCDVVGALCLCQATVLGPWCCALCMVLWCDVLCRRCK